MDSALNLSYYTLQNIHMHISGVMHM